MSEAGTLAAALDLARRGFRVFPLAPGTKRPAIERWQELATTDEAVIRKAWSQKAYNIGVLCGGGLIGIDIDVKNGKPGEASFEALNVPAASLDTFIVRTPSGGRHVYFSGPDLSNFAGTSLGPGVDVRGVGGFLVGPGSVLKNGSGSGTYRVERDSPVHEVPAFLVDLCRAGRRSDVGDLQPAVDLDDAAAVQRARDWLREAPPAVERQGGDHTTFITAARVKDFGVSLEVACELMLDWNERCIPPWTEEGLWEKIANAYRYGQNAPGSDHPAANFSGVEVEAPEPARRTDPRWFRHGDHYDVTKARWTFYGVLPDVGTAVIVGPSTAGKTFLTMELARCLATGKPFFGTPPDARGGTVFLFAGTEGSGFPLRLAALQEAEDMPISATSVQNLAARGALGALLETLREEAARMDLMFGVPLRMVVLETLSASGLLVDENSNSEAAQAWANLGQIANTLGILFVTTHHPPKEGRGSRGAGALFASPDGVLEIYREGRDSLRRVEIVKVRNGEQRMLGTFSLLPVKLGKDEHGRDVTSATVTMGEPIKVSAKAPSRIEAFINAIEFTYVDAPKMVNGEAMVEKAVAIEAFNDIVSDVPDRSNKHKLWKKCLDYAIGMGVVETQVHLGIEYLAKKDFET